MSLIDCGTVLPISENEKDFILKKRGSKNDVTLKLTQ